MFEMFTFFLNFLKLIDNNFAGRNFRACHPNMISNCFACNLNTNNELYEH